ncbi:MAG: CusA/CzcA family heavy metal efflux RND transporter [Bryobacteraceae bacterium]|nr:CusA/CzcA family heavy metal efflux RND transporter [Bryobacteraceae bacterium]
MISRVIQFSADHKGLVLLLTAALCALGWWSMHNVALDAIPDLSDTQVIIYAKWEQSPDLIEDQVTYPIITALLGAPKVRTVRGLSDFGVAYIYVIFEDGTDIYWARTRTLEYLSGVQGRLPKGVSVELGPDATGLGWVFQYALVDRTGRNDLAQLRSLQDWSIRYQLQSVPGVAEVAAVGGFVRQYQVQVDPNRLRAYNLPIDRVVEAVRQGNADVGGRLIEFAGAEYMIRGRGYARSLHDIEQIAVAASENGVPIRVRDIGRVTLGPDLRRGVADLNGEGDVVGGIVVMRQGENALKVIERVKDRLDAIRPTLPEGVEIVTTYDRSDLILRAIDNLKRTVAAELLVVAIVIMIFLWHLPSAAVPVITLPAAILISFIGMKAFNVEANIMSLGGIAIAIGGLVDAAIVVVEQTHKKLEEWEASGRPGPAAKVIVAAVQEVGPASFFSLLVIAVSFLPILALEAQEGRLFKPLAYTKNLAMIVAAFLAITLDPALRLMFTSTRPIFGRIRNEAEHPISRVLMRLYEPVCRGALRYRYAVIIGAVLMVLATIPVYRKLGSEFMPPLDEGSLLYMPTTLPGLSIGEAERLLQVQDRLIAQFPEVALVFGKAGRAETSTDPAPLSMFETVILLKPQSEWRAKETWYSDWAPDWLKPVLRRITMDRISQEELVNELNARVQIPGVSNAWTMPIKARIDMLTTGIRTPVGVKVSGADYREIDRLAANVERALTGLPGTRSVFAERSGGGYFLDFIWKREELARYGLTIDEAQMAVTNAIGGENLTTTVEGRERYPVNVRYARDFRSTRAALENVLVPVMGGMAQIPLRQLAEIRAEAGPAMYRNEDGLLTGYVYVDIDTSDIGGYLERAQRAVRENVAVPAGYALSWSGQYEAMDRAAERLKVVVPVTLALILLLLYLNTRSGVKTAIVLLAVPFSAIGAVWLLYLLDYNLSIAVWVGILALLGIDAETGVFMLLYLDLAYKKAQKEGRLRNLSDLREAIVEGAVRRIRPKFMTVATTFIALTPILWAQGTGADVMKRIAAPIVGGVFTSFLLELVVYPAIYEVWKWHSEVKRNASA